MTLEVDAQDAINAIKRLSDKQLPKFAKMFINDIADETRKVMIDKVTNGEIAVISGNLRSSIFAITTSQGIMVGPSIQDPRYPLFVALGTKFMRERPYHEWTMSEMVKRVPVIGKQLAGEILKG